MSEQNILNPTASSVMNPHYSIPHKDPQIDVSWQARSGQEYDRDMLARGMEWQLHWDKVPFSTYLSLRQWFRQYRKGFFSYIDFDDNGRYYSGKFLAEPQFERVGNNQVNVSATFVEIPKVPLFQYPSNWGVDSIFVEERGDYGQDLVKLTGTWDHRDQNMVLWSEDLTQVWSAGVNTAVTANTTAAPDGNVTADTLAENAVNGEHYIEQTGIAVVNNTTVTLSTHAKPNTRSWIYLAVVQRDAATVRGAYFNLSGVGIVGNLDAGVTAAIVQSSNGFYRCSVTVSVGSGASNARMRIKMTTGNGVSTYAGDNVSNLILWGHQFERWIGASTYTKTQGSIVALTLPNPDPNLHGGSAYFNPGTGSFVTDFAEWLYVGYGFRVWAPRGPDMGFMSVTLDGVVLGTGDLYAAAAAASSVFWLQQSTSLGQHRVKLAAINLKNAASSAFNICADAIEVMR